MIHHFLLLSELKYLHNQTRFGEPVFQLSGFLWGTEKWRSCFLIQTVEVFIWTYECKTMNDWFKQTHLIAHVPCHHLLFFLRVWKERHSLLVCRVESPNPQAVESHIEFHVVLFLQS